MNRGIPSLVPVKFIDLKTGIRIEVFKEHQWNLIKEFRGAFWE